MKDKLISSFKKLDFMGVGINLSFRGKAINERIFGSILTIAALAFTLASISNILVDYYKRTNPFSKIHFTGNHNKPIKLNRNQSELMLAILYFNTTTLNIEFIPFHQIEKKPVFAKYSKWDDIGKAVYKMDLVSCKDIYEPDSESQRQSMAYVDFCLPDIDIEFTTTSYNSADIKYTIEFDAIYYRKLIETYTYPIIAINYKMEHLSINNYTEPYSLYWTNNIVLLQKDISLYYSMELQNTDFVIQNTSFIFNNPRPTVSKVMINKIDDTLKLSLNTNDLKDRLPPLTIQFFSSPNNRIIEISFITLDQVLAAFGGTFNVVYFLFSLIYSLGNSISLEQSMINTIYSMHYYKEDKEVHNTNKSKLERIERIEKNGVMSEKKLKDSTELKDNVDGLKLPENHINKVKSNISGHSRKPNSYSTQSKILSIRQLDERRQYIAKYCDFCFLTICIANAKKSNKMRLLQRLIELQEKQLSVEGLVKLHFDVSTIKNIIYHNTIQDERLFSIPSFNIYKENKDSVDILINEITNNYNIWKETMILPTSKKYILPLSDSVQDILLSKYNESIE